jgi:xylulokinase
MLEWYRRQLTELDRAADQAAPLADWETLIAEASASPAGARGVVFLPHLSGAACPMVDPKSLGAFAGLNNRVTRGDMLRAIIEGLDYQFLDIVCALESALGTRLDRFVAVGGATRNRLWMQNKADVTGREIQVPDVQEATPLGAAILAGIGVGLYCDEEDAFRRVHRPGTTYLPDPANSRRYEQGFRNYRELYPSLKTVSHRLYEESMT